MKKLSTIAITVGALVAIVIAPAQTMFAVNDGAGQALEIAPPVVGLTADPGQTLNTQINLRNISSSPLVVTGAINDFTAQGEGGDPKIDIEQKEPSPYSIKPWMQPLQQLNMKSKEMQKLPVTIKVPKDAAPGGYWGVIRFTATSPGIDGTGVALSASLGSLIFVRVSGEAKESMAIEQFYTSEPGKSSPASLFESTPLDFVVRIKNSGSVHEQPISQVKITDTFNREVALVNVNLEQRNVLPGSIRKFTAPLDSSALGTTMLFGKYTAHITTTFGANKQTMTGSIDFWVIPYRLIVLIIIGLILVFFIVRALLKNYRRNITKRVRTSRR